MAQHAAALLSTERTNRAAVNGGGPVTYTDAASLGNAGGGSRVGLGGTRVAGNGTTQNNQNGTTTNGHSNGYEKKAGRREDGRHRQPRLWWCLFALAVVPAKPRRLLAAGHSRERHCRAAHLHIPARG